jgi:hypothetical protein
VTVTELIEFLEICNPDAEVLIAGPDQKYNIKEFLRVTDTMMWSGAPILTTGLK